MILISMMPQAFKQSMCSHSRLWKGPQVPSPEIQMATMKLRQNTTSIYLNTGSEQQDKQQTTMATSE